MGRPKKSEMNPVPTKERILLKALELIAEKGYDAVSVRSITKALGLNEATLYIYYRNKADLLDAIFKRLEDTLITPGFKVPPVEIFQEMDDFDLAAFLVNGARKFFGRADSNTLLTWRILFTNQYRHLSARRSIEEHIINAPIKFFGEMVENIKKAGKIQGDIDAKIAGRIIAAVFLQYSFIANLKVAWDEDDATEFVLLANDLKLISDLLNPTTN